MAGIWDVNAGEPLHRLDGHGLDLCLASFSASDDRMVNGGMARRIIWIARTGKRFKVLEGFSGYTSFCRFSAAGLLVLTGSSDYICRI
jgi:WD40 repeat protein